MKRKRESKIEKAGFTLVEILLVVVIISILAAVAIPNFSGKSDKAKKASAKASLEAISLALDMYEIDHGNYPSSLQGLVTGSGSEWDGPYLKRGLPKDPWGNVFIYSASGRNYTLKSSGPPGGPEVTLDSSGTTQ